MNINIFQSEIPSSIHSEGEEFLNHFFKSEDIQVESQKLIPKLAGDHCAHRVADFYLPKYGVYIEFFGMWNTNEEKKAEYREKKAIYEKNSIPCIYIYPENLGIIHYIFNKRLRAALVKHGLKKELIRFNLRSFINAKGASILWFFIAFAFLVAIQFDRKAGYYWQTFVIMVFIVWFLFYRLSKSYNKYFREGYSYVNFKKE